MIKKFIPVITAASIALSVTAFAKNPAITEDGNKLHLSGLDGGAAIIAAYDENGALIGSSYIGEGETAADAVEGAASYRIISGDDTYSVTPVPMETSAPSPTGTPEATPTASAKPVKTPIPPAYERELDAKYTFSVVTDVSSALDAEGEKAYRIGILYQGEKAELIVPANATIFSASDYYQELKGKDASALKAGDLVYFEKNTRGTVRAMALIHRPLSEEPITSGADFGTDFEKLIAASGRVYATPAQEPGTVVKYSSPSFSGRYRFAYGAIMETGSGFFTLFNKSGRADNAIDVFTTDNTIVYTCDLSGKRPEIDTTAAAAIPQSFVPDTAYDDNGNVTFTEDGSYSYAFARIINGTASEVVIYTGYAE